MDSCIPKEEDILYFSKRKNGEKEVFELVMTILNLCNLRKDTCP
jgi:hypothetical protein